MDEMGGEASFADMFEEHVFFEDNGLGEPTRPESIEP